MRHPERPPALAAWLALALLSIAGPVAAEEAARVWTEEDAPSILDKTLTLELGPDLADLRPEEVRTVELLLEAGDLLQRLYEDQKHAEALAARKALEEGDSAESALLYRLFSGPIATTLDNHRIAFLPVAPEEPGRHVYPHDLARDEMDRYLAAHPERRAELLHVRSVVRRGSRENVQRDLDRLDRHPVLDTLHPGLRARLEALRAHPDGKQLYGLPYSLAWAEESLELNGLLEEAASTIGAVDEDFAAYLRLRARDLLADDYEAGDAAWVSGSFDRLNAQIGSYETYDDKLYGVKSFYSLSLLLRDRERSERLAAALTDLQALEDALPYDRHKRVRRDIPVGVYRVVADFGQARGTNTATILPNEAAHARKYGRTILLRHNVMTHPQLFELAAARFRAAVEAEHADDLTLEGGFERTLWHEVGHYLGVDRTADGRDLGEALERDSDLFEELKSDLVSLYSARALAESGYLDEAGLRAVYASGVLRVLQLVEPRRDQPYQMMQLMQWNYFLDQGLLSFDESDGRLGIDYERYHRVVEGLLREVLAIQSAGDAARAEAFVERWGHWRDDLHEVVAHRLREAVAYRYRLVRYRALDGE